MGSSEECAKLSELRVRDPFILADPDTRTYYLCTSLYPSEERQRPGVGLYTSSDLVAWQGPFAIFDTPDDFWAQGIIWAPELHRYQDRYYLFLTFNTDKPLPESAARLL